MRKSKTYDSEAAKMLDRNMQTIEALIDGMEDVERVQEWIETEVNNQCRQKVIGKLNRRKMELE